MFASKDIFLKSSGGYTISRSVRLRSSASASFTRTMSASGTTDTWSMWVKRGKLGATQALFDYSNGISTSFGIDFTSGDNLTLYSYSLAFVLNLITTSVYRDPSAWYHIVCVIDTTQATSTNRAKIYVNGVQVTAFSTATYPAQNTSLNIANSVTYGIGVTGTANSQYLDGYLTEINFIDGQALTPSSFGQTNTVTGVWQPIKYTGTYGTNGFYLNFSDNSAATATTIGKDYSGNGNNWTPNNISVTAGATYDSMLDVPTLYADGGNGRGNYAVLNPVDLGYNATTSEANLKVSTASAGNAASASTMALSTNTYWEVTIGSNSQVGLIWGRASDAYGNSSISMFASGAAGSLVNATRTLSATPSWSNGDTLGFAWNNSTRVLTLYQAGSATAVMTMTTPATGDPNVAITNYTSGAVMSSQVNFGQRPFTYTPPTGFVALNTQNLPTPTISNGANYMAATLYTGTNATLSITNTVNGVSSKPDFLWVKRRDTAGSHLLWDSVRGVTLALNSDRTAAEQTATGGTGLTSFNSNGFTLGGDFSGTGSSNTVSATYVAWQWQASGSTVSNTSGSITSTVSAGATQGFSVVTYTGNATNGATVGHGLGVAPSMIIFKNRSTTSNWYVYHSSLGTSTELQLNTTAASFTPAPLGINSLSSTVINLNTRDETNGAYNYVAYCFAAVAGYSAFGSYTGNGSTDGPFIYTGFRPRFILTKCSSLGSLWAVWDTSRNTYNAAGNVLQADSSSAEVSPYNIDILSNGFKFRDTNSNWNGSGATFIYAAFCENPFKLSLAR